MLYFDNASPIPRKNPVHFRIGFFSRSVQSYTPADHSLSWYELMATQGRRLAVFMALVRLELLSIKAVEAKKPVHPPKTLYISSHARIIEDVTFSWILCKRAPACVLSEAVSDACGGDTRLGSLYTPKILYISAKKPVHFEPAQT